MTYRRLFHILLIGSTILLAAAWWGSFTTGVGLQMNAPNPPFTISADLVRANVRLYAATLPVPPSNWSMDIGPYPASDYPEDAEENLMGDFGWFMHSTSGIQLDPLGPHATSGFLQVPVWAPYLLFIASAWGFCRVMERRSGRGKEKLLAEAQDTSHSDS